MISMPSSIFTISGSRYLFGELETGTVVGRGTLNVVVSTIILEPERMEVVRVVKGAGPSDSMSPLGCIRLAALSARATGLELKRLSLNVRGDKKSYNALRDAP
jgi:hypothetical protein